MNVCTKSSSKDARDSPASFEPTFVAIGKILDLSDKMVHFEKKNKKRKKCFQKKPVLLLLYD